MRAALVLTRYSRDAVTQRQRYSVTLSPQARRDACADRGEDSGDPSTLALGIDRVLQHNPAHTGHQQPGALKGRRLNVLPG
jgi:hypothetical protein